MAATFDASKTFTGTSLAASTTYQLTLTEAVGLNLSLLSALNLTITQGGTTVMDTLTGTALGGASVNLISLFSNTTAVITFTTPSTLDTSAPMTFDINGGTTAGLLGSSVTFSNASIQAVPEPSEYALMGLGCAALLGLHFRRIRRKESRP